MRRIALFSACVLLLVVGLLGGLLCLALPGVLLPQQFVNWEKFTGAWKQIPGPDDPLMLKVEREGIGVKFSVDCKRDGSCPIVVVGSYDGKPYKDSVSPTQERSFRKTGERTMQEDGYLGGKQVTTVKWQLSSDGNTLTRSFHFMNVPMERDKEKDVSYVYDRSGGPVSKDDPFVGFWRENWVKSDPRITRNAVKNGVLTITIPAGPTIERNCNDQDHPTVNPMAQYSCHLTSPLSYETVFKQGNEVFFTRITSVSENGKRMVSTSRSRDGKPGPETVWEKVE